MKKNQRPRAQRFQQNLREALIPWQARAGPKVLKIINPERPVEVAPPAKKGVFSNAFEFRKALEKRGFVKLGEGHYSAVYGKPGYDRVIKVSRTLDNWIDYVAWASKNGFAGNFAPKVYSWKRFKNATPFVPRPWEWEYNNPGAQDWSVAIVERMKETLNADSQLAKDFKIIERLHDLPEKSLLAEVILDEVVPGVGSFFKKLHQTFRSTDIYSKNMMIREDGTFCVTDPVCGTVKTKDSRFKAGDFTPPLILFRRYFESSS
jgi:hypothetical protein